MKKILPIILFCVAFAACKKDKVVNQVGTLQDVTFKVGFSQTSGVFEPQTSTNKIKVNAVSADTSLTNYITRLAYLVYGTDGKIVKQFSQTDKDNAFGKYTYKLMTGNYTVVVAGGINSGVTAPENLSTLLCNAEYYKKFNIIVGNDAVIENVELNHVYSRFIFHINDELPKNTNYIKLTVDNIYPSYKANTGEIVGTSYSSTIEKTSAYGTFFTGKDFELSKDFLYKDPLNAKITVGYATRAQNGVVDKVIIYREKSFTNIVGGINSRIKLSGDLFAGSTGANGGFTITIDSAWNAPINQGF